MEGEHAPGTKLMSESTEALLTRLTRKSEFSDNAAASKVLDLRNTAAIVSAVHEFRQAVDRNAKSNSRTSCVLVCVTVLYTIAAIVQAVAMLMKP